VFFSFDFFCLTQFLSLELVQMNPFLVALDHRALQLTLEFDSFRIDYALGILESEGDRRDV